jgi:hypothetical protein
MKILYAGVYNEYLNPTERNYLIMMKNLDAVFYGPGFVSEDILKKGIDNFIQNNDGFDFIITTTFSFEDHLFEKYTTFVKDFTKYRYIFFPKKHLSYIKTIKDDILKINDTNIIYIIGFDPYNIKKDFFNILKKKNIYTILLGKQFISSIDNLKTINKEKFSKSVNDNYFNFINNYDNKIISFYHIIGENEFKYNALDNRKYEISVMGVLYNNRKNILKQLKKSNIKLPSRIYNIFYSFLNKIGFSPYSNIILLYLYNSIFQYNLFNSKISFTSGSELNIPVRKFFEIPAHASLLLAYPCNGFEDLGFKNNINYIKLNNDEDIIDITTSIINDKVKAQDIATKGQELIFRHHSTTARSNQLKNCLEAIQANNYNGSFWKNGEFKVRLKND